MTALDVWLGPSGEGLAVETARTGQLRLVVPALHQLAYPTGEQVPCARCAERHVHKLGVRRFPGDPTPLCKRCWRLEERRRARQERAELAELVWQSVGEVAAAEHCPACGPARAGVPATADLLPAAAVPVWQRRRARRRARGESRQAPCWLCEVSEWARLRTEFEREQSAAAAAEAAAAAVRAAAVEAEFARLTVCSEAEARVEKLRAWVERICGVLEAYHAGRGHGRAVELVAEVLARQARHRTSARGRPSGLGVVSVVQAVGANSRSGRRAMEGREWTAEAAGVGVRTVTSAWREGEGLGAWIRVVLGRRLTFAERCETGRGNDRTVFDFTPLHRGDASARVAFVAPALALFARVLERGQALLQEAESVVDQLRAEARAVHAAARADSRRVEQARDWAEYARRARMRQAVVRTLSKIENPAAPPSPVGNFGAPHTVSRGENVSSCSSSKGLSFSTPTMIHSATCCVPPFGGRRGGASRSSTEKAPGDLGCGGSHRQDHPRKLQEVGRRPQGRSRPAWATWARDLTRDLVKLWPGLVNDETPLPWIAATLGSRLGPGWSAETLLEWLVAQHGGPVLAAPDLPARYLRQLLDRVLTSDVTPPHPARRHDEHRRGVAAAAGAELRARQERARAELDARDAAAAAEREGAGEGRAAARARAEQATADRAAARQARGARLSALESAQAADDAWPPVAAPGSGLPVVWRHGIVVRGDS
jgi:hypothetical protein